MPRTKTISDQALMGVLKHVLRSVGPAQITLTDVAKEADLTPSTLLQRFGSKRGLLLAFARHEAEKADFPFRRALAATKSPLQALRNGLSMSTNQVESRQQVVNGLAMSMIDLDDADLLAAAQLHARNVLAAIGELIEAAIAAGELEQAQPGKLALAVQCAWNGAVIQWAIDGERSFDSFLDDALTPLIGAVQRPTTSRSVKRAVAQRKAPKK